MTLQSSGPINMADVNAEADRTAGSPISVSEAFTILTTYPNSDGVNPQKIDELYSADYYNDPDRWRLSYKSNYNWILDNATSIGLIGTGINYGASFNAGFTSQTFNTTKSSIVDVTSFTARAVGSITSTDLTRSGTGKLKFTLNVWYKSPLGLQGSLIQSDTHTFSSAGNLEDYLSMTVLNSDNLYGFWFTLRQEAG